VEIEIVKRRRDILNMSTIYVEENVVTFSCLAAAYGVITVVSLIQLIRIHAIGFPWRRITTQKTFLMLLVLTGIFRVIFFISISIAGKQTEFDMGRFNILYLTILDDFGCMLFFTTFCLLILFWIEIVYHSKNKTRVYRARVRPIFYSATSLIYMAQVAIWILIIALPDDKQARLMNQIDNVFYSTISLCEGFGFFYYGVMLSLKLKRNPINSKGKKKKLIEVILFTVLCTIAFLTRSQLFLVATFKTGTYNVNSLFIALYYFVCEILPSTFVIVLFRKMPPRPSLTPTYRFNVEQASPHSSVGSGTYSNVNNQINEDKQPLLNHSLQNDD
ncbi:hypothetical protein SAMD00019534_030710, partial [Acytostelium subglobosum LB1]|uniref:hypothetical protein n=1 Tax=Acytostelium subglobosum LB1 TaxID=1410327 RepID=UPI000644943D